MQLGMIGLGRMGANMVRRLIKGGHDCVVYDRSEKMVKELTDAMEGDATLFARQDYVEEAWRIVDPYLKSDSPVYGYEPKTWGPSEADQLVSAAGGWHNPVTSR